MICNSSELYGGLSYFVWPVMGGAPVFVLDPLDRSTRHLTERGFAEAGARFQGAAAGKAEGIIPWRGLRRSGLRRLERLDLDFVGAL